MTAQVSLLTGEASNTLLVPLTGTPSPRNTPAGARGNLLPGMWQRYGIPQRSQRGAAGACLQRPEGDPHGQGEKGLCQM